MSSVYSYPVEVGTGWMGRSWVRRNSVDRGTVGTTKWEWGQSGDTIFLHLTLYKVTLP